MNQMQAIDAEAGERNASTLRLAGLALLAGLAAGLICALFRLALQSADGFRGAVLQMAQENPALGLPAAIFLGAAATTLAAFLVRRFSRPAAGSGIPHVELVLRGEGQPAPLLLIPVKFFGGLLAIGAGLALGREGPSVQMGASLAHALGRPFRLSRADARVLLASGAGAGLAVAFNAPIAGAIFVLEELVQRFEHRISLAAIGASAAAIALSRPLLGSAPDFSFQQNFAPPPLPDQALFLAAGLWFGALAVVYDRLLLGAMALYAKPAGLSPLQKAALTGAAVGCLGFFAPNLIGGGDGLTQSALDGVGAGPGLAAAFALRLALSVMSYAVGTPGGLFAPMLTLGTQAGLMFGEAAQAIFPDAPPPKIFALVGMAGFFAAVVRAPITGLALVAEMTGGGPYFLAMLAASFSAMLVPTLVGQPPIYDSLRAPAAAAKQD